MSFAGIPGLLKNNIAANRYDVEKDPTGTPLLEFRKSKSSNNWITYLTAL